jgi:hypothetical protein
MRKGSFTGKRLKDYIAGAKCDYFNARGIINVFDKAEVFQGYADELEALLRQSIKR